MLEGGLTMQKVSNPQARAKAYIAALNGISLWALLQAVKNLIRGEAKGMSTTFVPTSADLAQYCRDLEGGLSGASKKVFIAIENTRNKALGGKRISFTRIGKPDEDRHNNDRSKAA